MDNQTDDFITVLTFTYPHEIAIVRARLESEGIECFVQDELTVQVNPFYSNAVGGVKLQVRESDVEKTMKLLKEFGYLNDKEIKPSKFNMNFDRITSKIPYYNKMRLEIRLAIMVVIAVVAIVIIFYFATATTTTTYEH